MVCGMMSCLEWPRGGGCTSEEPSLVVACCVTDGAIIGSRNSVDTVPLLINDTRYCSEELRRVP